MKQLILLLTLFCWSAVSYSATHPADTKNFLCKEKNISSSLAVQLTTVTDGTLLKVGAITTPLAELSLVCKVPPCAVFYFHRFHCPKIKIMVGRVRA